MAEIKSSIELAMEKTKHLIMTEEEKKEQEKKELEAKIKGILRRFKDGYMKREEVMDEFRNLKEKTKKKMFIQFVLESIDPASENDELISLLESIDERLKEKIGLELKTIQKAFDEALNQRQMIVKERIREKLLSLGLEGDAMIINFELWDEWKEAKEEVQRIFSQRMERWRENIIESISF